MNNVEKLLEKIYLIDGHDLQLKQRTGTYVLAEDELTIIETSASPSIPYIRSGLAELGFSTEEIKYIIVTHIHLDHAGGAGLFLQECPNAKVIVHPKGERHLADPSRLIAGARAVYGEKFDSLFNPILPIPQERLMVMNDKDVLSISENCTLTFYDSPGHANHHFSIHHSSVNGMFTGDTSGILYQPLLRDGIEFYLPTTSPNQFDPEKMFQSMELFKSLQLDYIFFGHYGMSKNPDEVYKQVSYWLDQFVDAAKEGFKQADTIAQQIELTTGSLVGRIESHLRELGVTDQHEVHEVIKLDMEVCAMGLIEYLHKKSTK